MMAFEFKRFDQVLDYPCTVGFRVIVDSSRANALDGVKECINSIRPKSVLGGSAQARKSSGGKYSAYTVDVRVESSEHIRRIYTEVSELSYVKHII